MESLLELARGPWLLFAFAVCALGLARQVVLTLVELIRAYRKAGDQVLPIEALVRRSLGWIIPVKAFRGTRIFYTAASFVFHVGIILVPVFLAGHIALVRKGLGVSWPALNPSVADLLTFTTIGALTVLLVLRLVDKASRVLSSFQDWFLLALCAIPFLSGYLVAHPTANPLPFAVTYLTHLLSAELLLILMPFTKLVHVVLFAFTQVSWELGWHFVPHSGDRVRVALGKAGEPV